MKKPKFTLLWALLITLTIGGTSALQAQQSGKDAGPSLKKAAGKKATPAVKGAAQKKQAQKKKASPQKKKAYPQKKKQQKPVFKPVVVPEGMVGPKIRIDRLVFDWGSILQGKKLNHEFKIYNDGDMPLNITNVKPGCGCTAVDYDREIAPGEFGTLSVELKTDNLRGKNVIKKSINISSSDPKKQMLRAMIQGKVQQLLNFTPLIPTLSGLVSKDKEASVKIQSGGDFGIEITKITSTRNKVTFGDIGQPDENGVYTLNIMAKAGTRAITDKDRLKVELKTSTGEELVTYLNVNVNHLDRVTISPRPRMFFRTNQTLALKNGKQSAISQSVQLAGAEDDIKFKVLSVELSDNLKKLDVFEPNLTVLEEGKRYIVSLKLNKFVESMPYARGQLLIQTDDLENPTKTVMVFAQFNANKKTNPRATKPGLTKGKGVAKPQPSGFKKGQAKPNKGAVKAPKK